MLVNPTSPVAHQKNAIVTQTSEGYFVMDLLSSNKGHFYPFFFFISQLTPGMTSHNFQDVDLAA